MCRLENVKRVKKKKKKRTIFTNKNVIHAVGINFLNKKFIRNLSSLPLYKRFQILLR